MDRTMTVARSQACELLLSGDSVESFDAYLARGGGRGFANALASGQPRPFLRLPRCVCAGGAAEASADGAMA